MENTASVFVSHHQKQFPVFALGDHSQLFPVVVLGDATVRDRCRCIAVKLSDDTLVPVIAIGLDALGNRFPIVVPRSITASNATVHPIVRLGRDVHRLQCPGRRTSIELTVEIPPLLQMMSSQWSIQSLNGDIPVVAASATTNSHDSKPMPLVVVMDDGTQTNVVVEARALYTSQHHALPVLVQQPYDRPIPVRLVPEENDSLQQFNSTSLEKWAAELHFGNMTKIITVPLLMIASMLSAGQANNTTTIPADWMQCAEIGCWMSTVVGLLLMLQIHQSVCQTLQANPGMNDRVTNLWKAKRDVELFSGFLTWTMFLAIALWIIRLSRLDTFYGFMFIACSSILLVWWLHLSELLHVDPRVVRPRLLRWLTFGVLSVVKSKIVRMSVSPFCALLFE